MKQIQGKTLLLGVLVLASVQFTDCKSKKADTDTSTNTTTTIDSVTTPAPAPVEISADDALKSGLVDATKDFPGVTTSVNDGEVILTGNITRDKLPTLMQAVQSLHPRKVTNNLTIK